MKYAGNLFSVFQRHHTDEEFEGAAQQRNRELAAVGQIIAATATNLDLPAVLESALQGALSLTGLEGGTICLVNFESESLELAAQINTSPETVRDLSSNAIKIGECLCGNCARTSQPLILWDNASCSKFATREATRNEGIHFHAAFPLLAKGRAIGVLCVFARSEIKPDERSLKLVEDLCCPLALAVENARLFESVNRELAARKLAETLLEGQKQVLEMIVAGASLPEELTVLVKFIESQAPGMLGSILLLDEDGLHVHHGAGPSLPAEIIAAVDGQPIGPRAGSCGTAAYFKEAVYVEDIATDPLWKDFKKVALPHGLRACWSTPIFDARRQVLGTFAMYYREPGLPHPEHQRLIDIATHIASIAISHHHSEAALRESGRKYRQLVENANSVVLHWTRDGRIIFLNEFGQRLFGYTEKEIRGRHVIGTLVPETESSGRDLEALMNEICTNPKEYEQIINENMRSNGERVWIAWTNKVALDQQGRVAEILSIGLDITARKRAEEQVSRLHEELQRHAEELEQRVSMRTAELAAERDRAESADRVKSSFLATMSHELRTPLNSIIGFTGLLLQGLAGPLNGEQTKQLRMVKESGQHLLALINDVLDISKIEAGQIEIQKAPFDLRESIQKVVRAMTPLADKKQLPLITHIAPDMGLITSDRRRVEQILLNLLSNAIKFTEHGSVTLTAVFQPAATTAGAPPVPNAPGSMLISVRDTGIGIQPKNIDKLFRPFRQLDTGLSRQHEGTGLGLAICKRLVQRLDGAITVESEFGKGSTFQFTLPT